MELNKKIITIRCQLQKKSIKPSGKNKHAGFSYYELKDFLPTLNDLMLQEEINDCITIEHGYMTLTLIHMEEKQSYSIPFTQFDTPSSYKKEWVDKKQQFMLDKNGDFIMQKTMQDIQYLGALNTYLKRYLYLNAFGITDGEVIDNMNNDELQKPKQTQQQEQPIFDNQSDNTKILLVKGYFGTHDESKKLYLAHLKKESLKDVTDVELLSAYNDLKSKNRL